MHKFNSENLIRGITTTANMNCAKNQINQAIFFK